MSGTRDTTTTSRRGNMSDLPKRSVEQLEEIVKAQNELIAAYRDRHAMDEGERKKTDELIEAYRERESKHQGEIEAYREQTEAYAKQSEVSERLCDNQATLIDALKDSVKTLKQRDVNTNVLSQSYRYYAALSRAMLCYVIERNKERNWLRLWEMLPEEQKDVYLEEAKAWVKDQPSLASPELRVLIEPPAERICGVCDWDGDAELEEFASMSRSLSWDGLKWVCSTCNIPKDPGSPGVPPSTSP